MNNNIWEIKQAEKIACIDIDGVLMSCYPECWINYLNEELSTNFKDLNETKKNVSYDDYRQIKEKYRKSGIKETFPADPYAAEVTEALKQNGYSIIIMTARPANKYPELYHQTINWLNKNKILYDNIYFGEKDKHAKILSEMHHIKFCIEDNSYIANQIAKWGYKVYLVNTKYNEGLKTEPKVVRIDNLNEIKEVHNEQI